MPAVDPFSAAFVPIRDFDSIPSKPLPFAATLLPIDQNALAAISTQEAIRLPKPRKPYRDAIPEARPSSPYAHVRTTSLDLEVTGQALDHSAPVAVGTDEWMRRKIESCVDSSKGVLDLNNLGLTKLSTRIADLGDLVTFQNTFSPRASMASSTRVVSEAPRFPTLSLSDSMRALPTGRLAGNRPFARVSSAPAAMAHTGPGTSANRVASGLCTRFSIPPNHNDILEELSQSGSLLSSPTITPPPARSGFSRSKTGAVRIAVSPNDGPNHTALEIMAARNCLASLPTALFELSNLTVLSIRGNKLERLPAAIGQMRHLKELNISNNQIRELPATIIDLHLNTFHVHPNPLHPRSSRVGRNDEAAALAITTKILGPLERKTYQTVPRLYDICLNILITPRPPSHLSPLHDSFSWDREQGEKHPLLDTDVLHSRIPFVPKQDLRRCLQAAKSASLASHKESVGRKRSAFAVLGVSPSPAKPLPYPSSSPFVEAPDDASENPYYSPCPSPRHFEHVTTFGSAPARPSRRLYLHPAEERLEWCELFGHDDMPVRWRGCSPGCLSFLEADDEDDWGLDDFE